MARRAGLALHTASACLVPRAAPDTPHSVPLVDVAPGLDAGTSPCFPPAPEQVFGRVKATLTEEQALDLQTALSTATLDGELVSGPVSAQDAAAC